MASAQQSDIKIILCTIAYRDRLLDYVLDVASELGFDGVEVWGREPHISEQLDENRVRAVRRMAAEQSLGTPVLGSYLCFGATNERIEDRIELEDTLHIARCLDSPLVRVWTSDVGSAQADDKVWKRTVAQIRQACEQAARLGITFVAEMHSGTLTDTGPSAKRLVEEVASDSFRLNYQVASWAEPQTPLERLETVLPYVVHFHAQNYKRPPREGDLQQGPLRDGIVDYAALIGRLRETGYNGCLAVEFVWSEGATKRAALAADLAYLRSLTQPA